MTSGGALKESEAEQDRSVLANSKNVLTNITGSNTRTQNIEVSMFLTPKNLKPEIFKFKTQV